MIKCDSNFSLNEKEIKNYKKWYKNHRHEDIERGAIGGGIEFRFTPTGIGNFISVYCAICQTDTSITDLNSL